MISFKQIYKTYPRQIGEKERPALSDVTFLLNTGETLGLVGANGAGKSTTIRMLMGFLKPDKGEISVFGQSPHNHLIRRRIGYLPETASFPPNLTLLDMLRFTGQACQLSSEQIGIGQERWLKMLGLFEVKERPLRQYSKGMQQRANFAIALLNNPDLLILDEPMSGLDPFGRADIASLIQTLKKDGKTILFCSHILEDVDRLVDNVLVLHKGRNLFHGKVSELCEQQKVVSFVDAFLAIIERSAPA